jgi:hypothetical protein
MTRRPAVERLPEVKLLGADRGLGRRSLLGPATDLLYAQKSRPQQ